MNEVIDGSIKKIGFFGAYAYDVILYLARGLSLGGKQVLVIDRSTEQEVIQVIRSPSENDLQLGIFHFCGVDITARVVLPEKMNLKDDYDVVLYDFGKNMCPEEYHGCDVICYVLDMYVHNALRIQELEEPENHAKKWMILRDMFRGKAMARYHTRLTGKAVANDDMFMIPLNRDDFISRFRMETDQFPRIELASEEMQAMIHTMIVRLCPEQGAKRLHKGGFMSKFKRVSA